MDFVARITKDESFITESDTLFSLININHFGQLLPNGIDDTIGIGMSHWYCGFRRFIVKTWISPFHRPNSAELMRFVSRFDDHTGATANHRHLPPQRARGLRLRFIFCFPSLIYGCTRLHPPQRVAFLSYLTLPCL